MARERAMLLVGFGAALRRSELVALTLGDVETVPDRGLRSRSAAPRPTSTARASAIAVCANPTEPGFCPAAALEAWLAHRRTAPDLDWIASASSRAERPLFCAVTKTGTRHRAQHSPTRRSPASSSRPQQTPASTRSEYSGHSLRAGLPPPPATTRRQLADLMRQTRHRSTRVALGYLAPPISGATM